MAFSYFFCSIYECSRLDNALVQILNISRNQSQSLFESNLVLLNGKIAKKSQALNIKDEIKILKKETNKDIKNYDFYNPDNILIIDRKNPVIDKNFFVNDFIEIEEKIMDKYRLSSWIKDIFLYDNLEYKSNTFLKEE